MKKNLKNLLVIVLFFFVIIVVTACGSATDSSDITDDGDTTDGDTSDGDEVVDGDEITDGDKIDGDGISDGDEITDGDKIDGDDTSDGDITDGDTVDEDFIDDDEIVKEYTIFVKRATVCSTQKWVGNKMYSSAKFKGECETGVLLRTLFKEYDQYGRILKEWEELEGEEKSSSCLTYKYNGTNIKDGYQITYGCEENEGCESVLPAEGNTVYELISFEDTECFGSLPDPEDGIVCYLQGGGNLNPRESRPNFSAEDEECNGSIDMNCDVYHYDNHQNITSRETDSDCDGTVDYEQSCHAYEYDSHGNIIRDTYSRYCDDDVDSVTSFANAYDSKGRLSEIQVDEGDDGITDVVNTYVYELEEE